MRCKLPGSGAGFRQRHTSLLLSFQPTHVQAALIYSEPRQPRPRRFIFLELIFDGVDYRVVSRGGWNARRQRSKNRGVGYVCHRPMSSSPPTPPRAPDLIIYPQDPLQGVTATVPDSLSSPVFLYQSHLTLPLSLPLFFSL